MSLQQQMSLFQEGGLEQDGGTVDPVSGNDVPIGSSQEEVRDDIPAQLSEGEFVFPADVVRFIGLEKLMMMRQQAKAGLKRMEEMGQMGNSEEATIPDDIPFTIDDLDIEDEPTKMQTGGDVNPNTGTYTIDSKFKRQLPDTTLPIQPIRPIQPIQTPNEGARFYNAPKESDPAPKTPATYEELIGTKPYKYDELRKFVGPNGEIQYVAYKDGEPLPAYKDKVEELLEKGFTMEDPDAVEETAPAETTVETAKVTEDREGDSSSPENMNKRENEIVKSYVDTVRRVMDQEGLSAEEAVQFLKDGKYKVLGRTVPGFLFPNIKLANQNLTNPSPYTIIDPDNFDKSGNQISFTDFSLEDAAKIAAGGFEDEEEGYPTGTTFTSSLKPAEVTTATVKDKPEPVVSDMPMGSKPIEIQGKTGREIGTSIQDPSDIAKGAAELARLKKEEEARVKQEAEEKRLRDVETARLNAIAEAEAEKRRRAAETARLNAIAEAEAEKRRRAAETARLNAIARREQDKADREDREAAQRARDERTQEQKAEVSRSKREGGQGYVRAKGGLMNKSKKPKKKVMKRGGLASKK